MNWCGHGIRRAENDIHIRRRCIPLCEIVNNLGLIGVQVLQYLLNRSSETGRVF